MVPASIRTKNPGAMWGRVGRKPSTFFPLPEGPHGVETNAAIPLKWGSTKTIYLSDGMGQNNNIAIFPTWEQGICAQLDLWRTNPKYRNKRFADAIHTWGGGNNIPSYIRLMKSRVPGLTEDTILNDAFWKSPSAIPFLKTQATHEAGVTYPAPEGAWEAAQRKVMNRSAPVTVAAKTTGTAVATNSVTLPSAKVAADNGAPWWLILLIVAIGIAIPVLVAWLSSRNTEQR